MRFDDEDVVELKPLHRPAGMEEEEAEQSDGFDMPEDEDDTSSDPIGLRTHGSALDRRTKRKLDWILLPFLAVLFLLNSLDKSNVGNAETAGFTRDAGLQPEDLNTSMAFFFAFFVVLQPVGAALGRKFGMHRFVPACMSLWGVCTLLHMWIQTKTQLILLRIAIACLESGFYPTTVSYLSLFYTRYEFAVRLGFFYGQTAVAGVLGGILSWAVFSRFADAPSPPEIPPPVSQSLKQGGWKSWEILFLIEGCMTITVALMGFFWLPHSADTAWFLNARERRWAEERIRLDQLIASTQTTQRSARMAGRQSVNSESLQEEGLLSDNDDTGEAHHRLLNDTELVHRRMSVASGVSVTADAGLSRHDVLSAVFNLKIWHILVVNILSAVPATAFGVFLPLVIKELSPSLNLSPAASNLLSAPPFACGAVVLFMFTRWSDRSKRRLVPIFCGLGILLAGLTATVLIPMTLYWLRYVALCLLLSGSFIASPLTVTWLTNNTPEPGKRAIMLGINGWGNLAGIFLALLFTPADKKNGYIRPFIITLVCVLASFAGYVAFWMMLVRENKQRDAIIAGWTEEEREREDIMGDMPLPPTAEGAIWRRLKLDFDERRRGDERITYRYTL
ncbi:hypothetical protein LTR37_000222 [Vermiconidia calcicola]|uniref:Uncharacterized protein n=1 Tax=Vermiconidia calcicola TaxID=1690605 RepID=A0ACC3NZR5_9PEZI|nr:hypothetical protein LTR37_000222 [Vermiconidia calcicola]